MKLFKNEQLERLLRKLGRGHSLGDEGKHAEALETFQGVLEAQKKLGFTSGYTLYSMAIAADNAGELEMAFDYITRAIETDPLAGPFRSSFDIIARRLREALANGERTADDPSTPRLYDLLVRSGEADLSAHVVMARWCSTAGDHARAGAIAEAVTTLYPVEREAWLCKADVARAAGDADLAATCAAEAATLDGEPVPFSVPGVAQG